MCVCLCVHVCICMYTYLNIIRHKIIKYVQSHIIFTYYYKNEDMCLKTDIEIIKSRIINTQKYTHVDVTGAFINKICLIYI